MIIGGLLRFLVKGSLVVLGVKGKCNDGSKKWLLRMENVKDKYI